MTAPTATRFTVTKGNPTEDELAALTAVLTDLQAAAKAKQQPADQNRWGNPALANHCLLYTSPSPRDRQKSRMPSSA